MSQVTRGIQAVRADVDAKAVLAELNKAFSEFKAENDTRLKEVEKKGNPDPLLAEKVDKISTDMLELSKLRAQLESVETAVARNQFQGGGSVNPAKAEHAKAFNSFFRKGVDNGLRDLEVKANLSTLVDADGGYLVPEEEAAAVDRIVGSVSSMRQLSSVMSIGTDTYKKLVGLGGATSGWVEEKAARPETSSPTLTEIIINTKEIYAMPAATQSLLDDSRIDIGAWLGSEVATVFAEQEGEAFINGTGVGAPKGLNAYTKVVNASYAWGSIGYNTSGAAAALTNPDALKTLKHSLKPGYRTGASWLMNDSTFLAIDQLKDSDGNYLWRPGMVEGSPDTLLGKPIAFDDHVDSIAAGKFPIYFGNFKRAYLIVDRFGIRVLRDPYTNKPYVMFYTTKRVGGGVVMFEAIKSLKISA